MFWVPQSGRLGMGISIYSYNGQVTVGVITDEGLVPDPERITEYFGAEFRLLADLAGLPPAPVQQDEPDAPDAPDKAARSQCIARTRTGSRCRNQARPGSRYCAVHAR